MGLYIGKMDRKWLSRVLIIMLADILGILGSYLLALWARFDLHFMDIPPEFLQGYLSTIWWWVLICLAVFWLCNLYNSIWRFVSVDALMRIILAYVILGGLSFGCVKLFHIVMPRSYYVWGLLCSFFITAGIRFFYRGVRYLRNRVPGSQKGTENVMIIGAGQAGRQLIREYAVSSHLNSRVACLIDDNPAKRGRILEGVRIVGGRRDIPQAVKRYDIRKIIFTIPSLQGAGRQEILNICSKTGCQIQVVPGIYQLVKGEVTISKLRRVELQDLLGRDPIRVNLGEICGYINDKTVLITGGGGSMSSRISTWYRFSRSTQLGNTSAPRTPGMSPAAEKISRISGRYACQSPASARNRVRMQCLTAAPPHRPIYGIIRPRIMTMAIKRATPMATYRVQFCFFMGFPPSVSRA